MKKYLMLALIMAILVSMTLAGCTKSDNAKEPVNEPAPQVEPVKEESVATNETDKDGTIEFAGYKQSPALESKNLPPVEERLPKEPKLVNEIPAEQLDYEIGTYGGIMRTATMNVDFNDDVFGFMNEPLLNTPGMLGEEITGNVLKDYEVSADQKEFTFFMREGLKWSDGAPVTVEDVEFTVMDVLFNTELTPIVPAWLKSGGKGDGKDFEFEVIDQYTFKMKFDEPYGGLLLRIAIQGWRGYTELLKPKHYLKQFHTSYTPLEDLESLIKEEGFSEGEWVNLFNIKDITNWEFIQNKAIGFPVLSAWMLIEKTETVATFERNPYFFKVDAAGNQLPYIDTVESYLVQDAEMAQMKIISGEIDFSRALSNLIKMPLYKENEQKGGYRVTLVDDHGTQNDVFLNMTHDDPVWREVVRNVKFRQALNLAIDRDEIADTVYYGFSELSPMNDSTYDLQEANKLLDEIGMKKGSDGFRLGPNGKTFEIPFEIGAHIPAQVATAELIVAMWKDLGLKVTLKTIDGALWGTRNNANELMATIIWTHSPLWWYGDMGQGFWAPLWNRWWNTGGNEGEEPPEDVKRFYRLMDKITVGSPEEGLATYEEIKREMKDNLWYFLPAGKIKVPMITKENMGNVPEEGYVMAINFSGESFFYNE